MNRQIKYNPDPKDGHVGECAVRACCRATECTWNEIFGALVQIAYRRTFF